MVKFSYRRRRPIVGVMLVVVGLALCSFSIMLYAKFMHANAHRGLIAQIVAQILLLAPGLTAGPCLITLGRRMLAFSAENIIEKGESFVLFLRSFGNERAKNPEQGILRNLFFWEKTYEEEVCTHLRRVGRMIAVGRPSERFPTLGARRMYLRDDEWREAVDYLLRHCNAAVFLSGKSTGLRWEMQRAFQVSSPERLLFLIPATRERDDRVSYYAALKECLDPAIKLPEELGNSQLLTFSRDGTARLLPTVRPWVHRGRRSVAIQLESSLLPFVTMLTPPGGRIANGSRLLSLLWKHALTHPRLAGLVLMAARYGLALSGFLWVVDETNSLGDWLPFVVLVVVNRLWVRLVRIHDEIEVRANGRVARSI